MDIVGVFPTIEEARELIPRIEKILMTPFPVSNLYILRIVESNVLAINENFAYDLKDI